MDFLPILRLDLSRVKVLVQYFLGNVRERTVSDIVKQRSKANQLYFFRAFRSQELERKPSRHMHDADGMVKACMICARVNQVSQGKLFYPPQPLKNRSVNHPCLQIRTLDEPVN